VEKTGPKKQPSKPKGGEKKATTDSSSTAGRSGRLRVSAIIAVAVAILRVV